MTHITINTQKDHQGIRFSPALAPKDLTPDTPGKDVGEIRFNPAQQKATVSLGTKDKIDLETFRRAGGAIAKWTTKNKVSSAAIETASFSDFGLAPEQIAFALAEGLLLGSFRFDRLKSKADKPTPATIYFLDRSLKPTLKRATILCEAVNLTRSWAHEPANVINPVTLAEKVKKLAKETGLKCTVIDDKQLTKMGAGAIVAVGQGSQTPSRLIVLEYQPSAKKDAKPVALIGNCTWSPSPTSQSATSRRRSRRTRSSPP